MHLISKDNLWKLKGSIDDDNTFYINFIDLFDIFQLSFFGTAYVLPMVFMCVLYSIMLHRLWKTGPVGRASAESIRNKKRVVKVHILYMRNYRDTYPMFFNLSVTDNILFMNIPFQLACYGCCLFVCHMLATNSRHYGVESIESLC